MSSKIVQANNTMELQKVEMQCFLSSAENIDLTKLSK